MIPRITMISELTQRKKLAQAYGHGRTPAHRDSSACRIPRYKSAHIVSVASGAVRTSDSANTDVLILCLVTF